MVIPPWGTGSPEEDQLINSSPEDVLFIKFLPLIGRQDVNFQGLHNKLIKYMVSSDCRT